jgi:hypothetical protein
MIPSGVEVYVASTPVDLRKGLVSLMALVRDGGVVNGALYVFRSKRDGDRQGARDRQDPIGLAVGLCARPTEDIAILQSSCGLDSRD